MKASVWIFGFGCALLVAFAGCWEPGSTRDKPVEQPAATSEVRSEVLRNTVDTLRGGRVESERSLDQAADRLNQWLSSQTPEGDWQPDPLVGTLPPGLRREFGPTFGPLKAPSPLMDLQYIQQVIWLQEISNDQRGGQPPDLVLAQRLFDWTVRNIQLEYERLPDQDPALPGRSVRFLPWQVLLTGRGSALQRAWVFVLLARQQGLPVVMLARPSADAEQPPRPWLPALLHQGELYLFDPALGLPVPALEEEGLPLADERSSAGGGQVAKAPFRLATLKEALATPELFRKLDVSAEEPYPADPQGIKEVVALVEASPFALSRRMTLISELARDQNLALTTAPAKLAEELRQSPHVAGVQLWSLPFEAVAYQRSMGAGAQQQLDVELAPYFIGQPLRQARILYFRGEYEGDEGAKRFYMDTRAQVERDRALLKGVPQEPFDRVKETATYGLGLATYAEGNFETTVEHLGRRTLTPALHGPWSGGARYNLARAYEQVGQLDKAIELYEADESPQQHGNRLRARRLRNLGNANP